MAPLGSTISVSIPESLREVGMEFSVQFNYATDPEASAIQWLEPSATKGGLNPFVFTQCQAIHARSLLPCFDSPGAKSTFVAVITAPAWATGEWWWWCEALQRSACVPHGWIVAPHFHWFYRYVL